MKDAQTNWDCIVFGSELEAEARRRATPYEEQRVHVGDENKLVNKGWCLAKKSKNGMYLTLRHDKNVGNAFEDQVWTMFKKLGFKGLNKGRKFNIWKSDSKHKQIDVFAVDDDVVVIVECKATETLKTSSFKTEIEAMDGLRPELIKKVKEKYPNHKVCFVWAMCKYLESPADRNRLKDAGFIDFQDEDIAYFTELAAHLGPCAKYQLFARLFANAPIDDFDNRVPAIKSKFGKYDCYTFAIEPERLLKIGYILHHHSSNDSMMPTYQRLIKRTRLAQIREFIEKGGYFANSLLISIDTHGNGLKFDKNDVNISASSEIGVLYLPNQYLSAYIIDGQHRLYAYSGSSKSREQTVPVVAFVDLDHHEQLKLFMAINENQKSVPKCLRVTLNADMLWDSPNKGDQRLAIASYIAQKLNDDKKSNLKGRIIIGENEKAPERTTTVNAVQEAILIKSGFLNKYKKNGMLEHEGYLDFDDNEQTANRVFELLWFCFDYIQEQCPEAWQMTEDDATIVVTGRGIHAIIQLIGDIVAHLKNDNGLSPKTMDVEDLIKEVEHYLDPLCDYINLSTEEERKELRKTLGGKSFVKFWRQFQKVVRDRFDDFNPPGLDTYLLNETKQFNDAAKSMIDKIVDRVKEIVYDNFLSKFRPDLQLIQFPKLVYNRIEKELSQYAYNHNGEKNDYRNYLNLGDLQKLVITSNNWLNYFESELTPPWCGKRNRKVDKTQWMLELNDIYVKLSMTTSSYSVSESEYQDVVKLYKWLVDKKLYDEKHQHD